jgi:hypothetical protein
LKGSLIFPGTALVVIHSEYIPTVKTSPNVVGWSGARGVSENKKNHSLKCKAMIT